MGWMMFKKCGTRMHAKIDKNHQNLLISRNEHKQKKLYAQRRKDSYRLNLNDSYFNFQLLTSIKACRR